MIWESEPKKVIFRIDAPFWQNPLPDRGFSDMVIAGPFVDLTSGAHTNKNCSPKMKNFLVTALLALLHCPLVSNVSACWASPPDYEFLAAEDEKFFFRKDNINKIIEVRRSETLDLVWRTEIEDLSTLFSKILVADDGKKIIRIKGNHEVNSLSDTAVEYFHQDGTVERFPASHFVRTLHTVKYPNSTSPAHIWHSNFRYTKDSGLEFYQQSPVHESRVKTEGSNGGRLIQSAVLVAFSILVTFILTYRLTSRRS